MCMHAYGHHTESTLSFGFPNLLVHGSYYSDPTK